jgi:hypothetical protein
MMTAVLLSLLLITTQNPIPKNNPNGVWEAETGSKFELKLSGSDLKVAIVPGSNPRYLQYELDLKNQDDPNMYKGAGYFVAKMSSGKECKFETEWQIVVVAPDRILGAAANIVADGETCEVRERSQVQLDLKKIK